MPLRFFLVSQSLMCSVTSAKISAGYKTDHSLIDIRIALHSNPRGPGFRELNTAFLTEIDYVNQIRDVIKKTHEEYQYDDTINRALLWEMMKLKTREQSIKIFNHFTENYGMVHSLLCRRIPLSQLAYFQFPVFSNKKKFVSALVINIIFPVIYFCYDNPLRLSQIPGNSLKDTMCVVFMQQTAARQRRKTAFKSMQ